MTKRDLVSRLAAQTGKPHAEIAEIVQLSLDCITNELAAGRGVELRNFAVFTLRKQGPRKGRRPGTPNSDIEIPERIVVKFKPGKAMRERVEKLSDDDLM
jgi:nucleoid DNA-binding protein